MPAFPAPDTDPSTEPRLKLPAMYTFLRARALGSAKYIWTGHLYDISMSGMRFELDMPIEAGTLIEVRGMLPGKDHTSFRATGRVTRQHSDAEDRGPVVMDMVFDQFRSPLDAQRLLAYLQARGVHAPPEPARRAA